MRDNTRPNPIHKHMQPIINCLKILSSGPSKFKRTANHNEGKRSEGKAKQTIMGFLSTTKPSWRSSAQTSRNKGTAVKKTNLELEKLVD